MSKVTFVDVYNSTQAFSRKPKVEAVELLFKLLGERPTAANISHKKMPSMPQHIAFIGSEPYLEWFMIKSEDGKFVGAIYLTHKFEVGIAILKEFERMGYGEAAIKSLMHRYPHSKLLANIAPDNVASQQFFESLGFKKIQHTYELPR